MELMQDARKAALVLFYNGKDVSTSLADFLIDFSYNDAPAGEADDISINLEDRHHNWIGPWSPMEGDKIKAEIRTVNWEKRGEIKKLPLGSFEVDTFDFKGSPDTVSIKALSISVYSDVRQEKRSRSWEKVSLKTVAAQVAKASGLKLLYEVGDNPTYDRLEQNGMSDLAFLVDTAKKEAIAVKVSGGNLVLFDESAYEKKEAITTITRGKDNVLSYTFNWSTTLVAYRACEVSYTDAKKKKTFKATYSPPGAPKTGPVLKINEQVDSQAAAIRLARKSLREKNKEAGKGSLTLMGDIRMATSLTINIKGWKRFDGKYIIESCSHTIGSGGYVTTIGIRKVLGW